MCWVKSPDTSDSTPLDLAVLCLLPACVAGAGLLFISGGRTQVNVVVPAVEVRGCTSTRVHMLCTTADIDIKMHETTRRKQGGHQILHSKYYSALLH